MANHRAGSRSGVPGLPRRRLLLGAAVLAPLLAACGSGFQAQTDQIYQPGPGITVRNGGVFVINTAVVTDGSGNGTLVGAFVNQQDKPDVLKSVTLDDTAGKPVKTTIVSGTIALPPQRAVQVAHTGDVRMQGTLRAGTIYTMHLTFQNAAPITVETPILAQSTVFSTVPVGPVPPPTTPSHSP